MSSPDQPGPKATRRIASPASLELLQDVEVEITLEIGRRRLRIADVLKLSTGQTLELAKAAGEPLDIFVNGRLLGRGEAIVIGDRYGVRITEVATPEPRGSREAAAWRGAIGVALGVMTLAGPAAGGPAGAVRPRSVDLRGGDPARLCGRPSPSSSPRSPRGRAQGGSSPRSSRCAGGAAFYWRKRGKAGAAARVRADHRPARLGGPAQRAPRRQRRGPAAPHRSHAPVDPEPGHPRRRRARAGRSAEPPISPWVHAWRRCSAQRRTASEERRPRPGGHGSGRERRSRTSPRACSRCGESDDSSRSTSRSWTLRGWRRSSRSSRC